MGYRSNMNCPNCHKALEFEGLCQRCHSALHTQLDDILEFWRAAHGELLPGNGGAGSSSGERTIGVNVQALSFIAGDDILGMLHEWEKLIRSERKLTPPAMLRKLALEDEIDQAVKFAQVQLTWSGTQPWFEDYAKEIKELHKTGSNAARVYVEKVKRIACPADTEQGLPCGQILKVRDGELTEIVECRKCKTQWTIVRLIAVALTDPRKEVWLDAEAIAEYLGVVPKYVYTLAKRHQIAKKGQLYNLNQILATRRSA